MTLARYSLPMAIAIGLLCWFVVFVVLLSVGFVVLLRHQIRLDRRASLLRENEARRARDSMEQQPERPANL